MAQKVQTNWLNKIKEQLQRAAHLNGSVGSDQETDTSDGSVQAILRREMGKKVRDERAKNLPLSYHMVL